MRPCAAATIGAAAVAALVPCGAAAATLPEHEPLRILIVSDRVNPHGLPPNELTEPGELAAAILTPGSGIVLDTGAAGALAEVGTDDIETATALLLAPRCAPDAYDVVVYFAHRIPDPNPGKAPAQQRQDEFVAAVEALLTAGGGLVSFHHGSYSSAGKQGILDAIGATATGAVPYDRTYGQDVVDVAPGHFVTANGITYGATTAYADPARGVPAGIYGTFNNVPDERYPTFDMNPSASTFEVLFGGKYDPADSTPHLLGFTHRRARWRGVVVGYQPGEYQPHACDAGNVNFQVLANAVVYAADALWPPAGDVTLWAVEGATPDELRLSWSGGAPCYSVVRSDRAAEAASLARRIAKTAATAADDRPPAAAVTFYQVLGR